MHDHVAGDGLDNVLQQRPAVDAFPHHLFVTVTGTVVIAVFVIHPAGVLHHVAVQARVLQFTARRQDELLIADLDAAVTTELHVAERVTHGRNDHVAQERPHLFDHRVVPVVGCFHLLTETVREENRVHPHRTAGHGRLKGLPGHLIAQAQGSDLADLTLHRVFFLVDRVRVNPFRGLAIDVPTGADQLQQVILFAEPEVHAHLDTGQVTDGDDVAVFCRQAQAVLRAALQVLQVELLAPAVAARVRLVVIQREWDKTVQWQQVGRVF